MSQPPGSPDEPPTHDQAPSDAPPSEQPPPPEPQPPGQQPPGPRQPAPPPAYGPPQGPPYAPPLPPSRGRGPLVLVVLAAAAVVTVMLAVAAVAILVLPDEEASEPVSSGPVDLRRPLTFSLVAQESQPPCAGGALPGPSGTACYAFGRDSLTVRRLEEVKTIPADLGNGRPGWGVALTLTSGDAAGFATLTGKAAQASRNRLPAGNMGMLVGGALVSEPAQVVGPITGGQVEINGPEQTFTRSYVEGIVQRLTGG